MKKATALVTLLFLFISPAEAGYINDAVVAVDTKILDVVIRLASNVITTIAPIVKAIVIIYIMLQGYLMMRGAIAEPIIDIIYKLLKISVILFLCLNVTGYTNNIVNFFNQGTDDFTNQIMGVNNIDVESFASQLDQFEARKENIIRLIRGYDFDGPSHPDSVSEFFYELVVNLIFFFCNVFMLINWLTAKIMLSVLLMLGPIFIACLILEQTKSLFFSWLGQVISNTILLVLSTILGKIVLEMILTSRIDEESFTTDVLIADFFLAIIICYIYYRFLSGIANALGGGFTINSDGAVGNAIAKSRNLIKKANGQLRGGDVRKQVRSQRVDGATTILNHPNDAEKATRLNKKMSSGRLSQT